MSKLKLNGMFVDKMSGRHGEVVVRSLRGKTFTSRRPTPSNNPPSLAQSLQRTRFKLANGYAQGVFRDATKRAFYDQLEDSRDKPAFALAVTDFLRSPVVETLDLSKYTGQIGSKITVLATDDSGVASVTVVIRSNTQAILEQGAATFLDQRWTYTGTTALPMGQMVTVEATAEDRPGNKDTKQSTFTRT